MPVTTDAMKGHVGSMEPMDAQCFTVLLMSSGGTSSRIDGLDALRGLAIALVLLRHSWPQIAGTGGVVGVVIFFTLSGYLITSLLDRDLRHFGRVRYGRFYRNRALRLIPALLLLLVGITAVTLVWNPLDDRSGLVRALVVGITYTANLPFDHGSPTVEHLWTLATEEQFYIVWPLVLALAVRFRRERTALITSTIVIVAALVCTIALTYPGVTGIYSLPTSWCVAMLVGAAAFYARVNLDCALPLGAPKTIWIASTALTLVLVVSFLPEMKASPLLYLVVGPLVSLASVPLIVVAASWKSLPSAWLTPLKWLGKISYAAYLWNWPIVLWLGPQPLAPAPAVAGVALTLLAATASWWLVERPAQSLRRIWERPNARPVEQERATS